MEHGVKCEITPGMFSSERICTFQVYDSSGKITRQSVFAQPTRYDVARGLVEATDVVEREGKAEVWIRNDGHSPRMYLVPLENVLTPSTAAAA